MTNNIIAKLLATCLCITTATSWDLSHDAQIRSLSSQIDNMKSLLNQPNSPSYKSNYGHELPWDNNINTNTDYERYLRQQYILPILNSLNDITEQIVSVIKTNNAHQQHINVPFPMKFYPPNPNFGDINDKSTPVTAPFGTVSGWGVPSYAHSQSESSGQSGASSFSASGFSSSLSPSAPPHGYIAGDSSGPLSYAHSHTEEKFKPDSRFPEEYDSSQNWGLVNETVDDNVRPISIKSSPKTPQECNCEEQNKNVTSLALQLKLKSKKTNPVVCKSVILLCCVPGNTEEERKECFTAQGCPRSYSTGIACLPVVIQAVYKDIYGNL